MNKFYLSFFWFLALPILSTAQPKSFTLADIELMYCNCAIEQPIKRQEVPKKDNIVRFTELGTIYNPTYPSTRNRVYASTYKQIKNEILYYSKSISTHRATVFLNGGVGRYYLLMKGKGGFSMIRYDVEELAFNYKITGVLYSQCSEAKRL